MNGAKSLSDKKYATVYGIQILFIKDENAVLQNEMVTCQSNIELTIVGVFNHHRQNQVIIVYTVIIQCVTEYSMPRHK